MKILRGNRANYAPTASSPVIAHVCAEKGSRCARCEVRAKFESTSSVLAESCNVLASHEQKRFQADLTIRQSPHGCLQYRQTCLAA